VDRFGDLVTDLPASLLADGPWTAAVGAATVVGDAGPGEPAHAREQHPRAGTDSGPAVAVPVGATFGSVESGEPIAYAGSWGTVEVAVRDGNAAARFGAGPGTFVELRRGAT
jgi:S-adenosylmethionine hydrolase